MTQIGIRDIQIMALAAVDDPSWTSQFRGICRWYSKEFSTPLHYVEENLTQYHVLRHYYEDSFKKLSESQDDAQIERYEEIKNGIINPGEFEAEVSQREEEDDAWADQMIEDIKRDEEKRAKDKVIKTKAVDSAESLNNPNIEDDIEFSVQGEDGPPEY